MSVGKVKVEFKDKIASITFSHPAGNSMTSDLLDEMVGAIDHCRLKPNINVILIKSDGEKIFCGGANITELASLNNQPQAGVFFMGFGKLMAAIKNCHKPVVVAVHGKVVGGGLGLIAACDYVLASKYATLKLSELSIGIGPFVISDFVERKIGASAFTKLSFNPFEWQTANWGKEKGLYCEVFETNEQLEDYTDYYTNKLSALDPNSLHEVKRMLWNSHHDIEKNLIEKANKSGQLLLQDFAQNKVEDFKNKK